MKQKIEWYREVLELEPGSRVFFPLAKLLAANGQTMEAVNTLRQGLIRHPDHVEARLLLVELLYLQNDDAGVKTEITNLGGILSLYPGFWKAWSEKLAETPAFHDASLALRFFAAALQGKNLNWTDVIACGLNSALHNAESAPARPAPAPFAKSDSRNEAASSDTMSDDLAAEQSDEPYADDGEGACEDLPEYQPEYQPAEQVAGRQGSEKDGSPAKSTKAAPDALADSAEQGADQPDADPRGGDEQTPLARSSRLDHMPELSDDAEADDMDETAAEEDEEAFSLRTRSMAEVLAEQGDLAGALEIYKELMLGASDEELADLQKRAEELTARLSSPASFEHKSEEKPVHPGAESTRLVTLLESLAQRLESRAR